MSKTSETRQIIKAIGELKNNVTVSEMVSATGLPVAVVSQVLNQAASKYGADLEVSNKGTLVYCFPSGFELLHLARGIKGFAHRALQKVSRILVYLLKISFGVGLIVSSGILYLVMSFLQLILSVSTGGVEDAAERISETWNIFNRAILSNLFAWSKKDSQGQGSNEGLLLECFSFLFGDTNPNQDIINRKWRLLGKLIHRNHGLVMAEQLAPYTGSDSDSSMLEVAVRFNGEPFVSDSGHIFYRFPALEGHANELPQAKFPAFLSEQTLRFSQLPAQSLRRVIGLALFTLASSAFLVTMIAAAQRHTTPHILGWLICLVYGAMFITVPGIRFLCLSIENKLISARNRKRESYAESYVLAAGELAPQKLELAQLMQAESHDQQAEEEATVYSTSRDDLEQQFDQLSGSQG